MNIIVLTPVRVLGDGLASCFKRRTDMMVVSTLSDLAELRDALARHGVDIVLIDVTQGVDLYDIRSVALAYPDVALVALGLAEQRQDVIRCGRAGFGGYVPRDASIEKLCDSLAEVVQGRVACPSEISGGLLRALFRADLPLEECDGEASLTHREGEVLRLIGRGLSNKEIARELELSVATVKHHVHHILVKLKLTRRTQAMRRVRDAPWLAATLPSAASGSRQI